MAKANPAHGFVYFSLHSVGGERGGSTSSPTSLRGPGPRGCLGPFRCPSGTRCSALPRTLPLWSLPPEALAILWSQPGHSISLSPGSGDEHRVPVTPGTHPWLQRVCPPGSHPAAEMRPPLPAGPAVQAGLLPRCRPQLSGVRGSGVCSQLISRRPALPGVPLPKGTGTPVTADKQLQLWSVHSCLVARVAQPSPHAGS